jgi:adenylate cyclase
MDAPDFAAEGLLEGLDDERERGARLELLERLHADGASLEELRDAVTEGRLVLMPIERALGARSALYTREDVAERANLDLAFLRLLWRALGMPEPAPGEAVFTDDDVEAAAIVGQIRAAGMPDEGILEISRVMGQSLSRLASAVGGVFSESFIREGDTEIDVGERFAQATSALAPTLAPIITYVFDVHQRQQLRRNMIGRTEIAAGRLEGSRPIAVAFADLVGFTRLGESVAAPELGAIAGRLERLVGEQAAEPVRLVKMIGDAAMLVSYETGPLLDACLALVEQADAQGEDFPQLRVGVATGDAIGRAGDWYGRPVNLASRICSHARAGSLLTTNEVRDALGEHDGLRWSRAGLRRFKGIRDEVPLYRVRRADPEPVSGT